MYVFTWNMQGSNAGTENKWNYGVKALLKSLDTTPILCLQECGGVPDSAQWEGAINFALGNGLNDTVDIYSWGGSKTRPAYYIFFHNWDDGSNRVNTAIVTSILPEDIADSVMLIIPAGSKVWRPALGVLFNDTWVFSFHAISPNGPDGADLLTAVSGKCAKWVVGADWNREPANLTAPAGSVICPPGANTYSVQKPKKKYDYCVCTGTTAITGSVQTTIITSDHYPVGYVF